MTTPMSRSFLGAARKASRCSLTRHVLCQGPRASTSEKRGHLKRLLILWSSCYCFFFLATLPASYGNTKSSIFKVEDLFDWPLDKVVVVGLVRPPRRFLAYLPAALPFGLPFWVLFGFTFGGPGQYVVIVALVPPPCRGISKAEFVKHLLRRKGKKAESKKNKDREGGGGATRAQACSSSFTV